MTEADYLHSLIKGAVREETDAQRRAGQSSSLWCYACGHMTADLAPCGCDFPSEFGCARLQNLCSGCREGHRLVAAHLNRLFNAKRLASYRVDSVRGRLYRHLRDALEVLIEKGGVQAKNLRFLIGAHADPRADESADFRRAILEAFRTAKFLDFAGLAAEIEQQERDYLVEKLAMSGIFRGV